MTNITLDPNAGSGTAMTMTAHGLVPTHILDAYVKAEADRLRKQEPLDPQFV